VLLAHRERLDNIGSKSPNFRDFTNFELSYFNEKVAVYFQRKVTRQKFDAIIRTNTTINQYVNQLCPSDKKTVVFYGTGSAQASIIKG